MSSYAVAWLLCSALLLHATGKFALVFRNNYVSYVENLLYTKVK